MRTPIWILNYPNPRLVEAPSTSNFRKPSYIHIYIYVCYVYMYMYKYKYLYAYMYIDISLSLSLCLSPALGLCRVGMMLGVITVQEARKVDPLA